MLLEEFEEISFKTKLKKKLNTKNANNYRKKMKYENDRNCYTDISSGESELDLPYFSESEDELPELRGQNGFCFYDRQRDLEDDISDFEDEMFEHRTHSFDENKQPIFKDSNISLIEFVKIFCLLVSSLNLCLVDIDNLLKFIGYILPTDTIIPRTYARCLKILGTRPLKVTKICVVCSSSLVGNSICQDPACIHKKKQRISKCPRSRIVRV